MASGVLLKEKEGFTERMNQLNVEPTICVADPSGIGMLAHADFASFEGEYPPAPFLMLNLCTAHGGQIRRSDADIQLEGILRPGTVALALPNSTATGYWSRTQMLGIAVNLDALNVNSGSTVSEAALAPAASRLHNDPLLTSIMTALWRDAEAHGISSAFFEQGIHVLLDHLTQTSPQSAAAAHIYPLRGPRLQRVLELMESRLADDVRVSELAAVAGQDLRTFSRAFAAATGYPPYAYFTRRRMELAKTLLRNCALPITDIAMQVGYTNPSKFSAAFRRLNGMSPRDWRNN